MEVKANADLAGKGAGKSAGGVGYGGHELELIVPR